jgi:2-polyprenyl-3-methyl-5-hydroxy-6-metoxy-1,4-benzoquinol methylase
MEEETLSLQERLDRLASGKNPFKVLEAGCGSSSHVTFKEDAYVVGIDISELQLQRNTLLKERILGDIQTYPFRENSYDLIICWDVLEHLPAPEKALKNFFHAVNEGGMVLLASPNVRTLRGLITKLTPYWFHVLYARYVVGLESAGTEGNYPFPSYHRWTIAPKAIQRMAEERGMVVELAKTYGFDHPEKKHVFFYSLWTLLSNMAHVISFGVIQTDKDAAFVFILRKPGSARSVAV